MNSNGAEWEFLEQQDEKKKREKPGKKRRRERERVNVWESGSDEPIL